MVLLLLSLSSDNACWSFTTQLYEDVWSQGRVLLLDSIMAEEHQQLDRVWQTSAGGGRRRMKRGVLAYRAAYPDIK
jgi:hypothetical protein